MVAGVALRSSGALALCAPAARTLARASHTSLGLARPPGPLPTCGCGASFGKVPATQPKSSWYVPGAAVANKECITACGKLVRSDSLITGQQLLLLMLHFNLQHVWPPTWRSMVATILCGCFLPFQRKSHAH